MATPTTRAKDPKIVGESQKIFRVIRTVFLWLAVVLLVISMTSCWRSAARKAAEEAAKQQQAAATAQPAPPQQWQLCWEKTPEHRGKTAIRKNCNSAVVERQDEILVVKYNFSGGQGVIIAPKTPDGAYLGTWRDSTGTGNIFLRFVSEHSAFGWQDDGNGTEKDPTSLVAK